MTKQEFLAELQGPIKTDLGTNTPCKRVGRSVMRAEDEIKAFKSALLVRARAIAPSYSHSVFQLCWMAIIALLISCLRKTKTYEYFRLVEDEVVINWVLGEGDRP